VRGDLEAAFTLHGRALAIKRGLKDTRGIGATLHNMGSIAFKDGDYRRAWDLFAQGFAVLDEAEDKGMAAMASASLADAARAMSDTVAAREGYARSLTLAEESGDRGLVAHCLDGVAALFAARGWRGDVVSAARLFGVAHELREATGTASVALDMEEMYRRDVETVRDALGADAFATAWADGRAMEVTIAITLALDGCSVP
jgi:tetratricopeptide (TPR) repeat protein